MSQKEIYDQYGMTNSRNAQREKEIGGRHRDCHRPDSAGPHVSGVWPERLPELHAPTEGHAAGNHNRYGRVDEGRYMTAVSGAEVIIAVLLLTNRFVPLALTLLAPIVV